MDLIVAGCVFAGGCVFAHIVSTPSKPGHTDEPGQAESLPLTEQERLKALTPGGYHSEIIEVGTHKRYCIYDDRVLFVYDKLSHIKIAFAAELDLN